MLVALMGLVMAPGCGSDSNSSTVTARILSFLFEQDTIAVGESTVVRSQFSFDAGNVFSDDQPVYLLFRLPPQVAFRTGSAEVQRPVVDDKVNPQIDLCPNGDFFLSFRLDEDDLAAASNPSGDADAELAFTIDALEEATGVVIEAAARDANTPFICDRTFVPDVAAGLRISPAVEETDDSSM